MTLSPLVPMTTLLWAAAGLATLAVVAYILKMRRRRFEVPFSTLWQRVLREKDTTTLWRHMRRILSLLLQLLILGLILFAALDPNIGGQDPDARNVVVIVDTSASMKTVDEESDKGDSITRIEKAKRATSELLAKMGGGDSVMLMRMDGQTTPMTRFQTDKPKLQRKLAGLQASDTPADLRRALSAAADALRDRRNPMVVLVGDGAYPEDVLADVVLGERPPETAQPTAEGERNLAAIDLRGVDLRYIPVGKQATNAGIIAFNVRRYITNKLSYEVFIEVQNFGDETIRRKLKLYSGDNAIDVKEITLKPQERRREIYPDLGGGTDHRLRAVLEVPPGDPHANPVPGMEAHDVFPLDDTAHALLPKRTNQKVLLVTEDNLYLEGAMLVYDNVVVDKLTPAEYEKGLAQLTGYNAVVFDDYTPGPEFLPGEQSHLLYFNPEGEHSPFEIRRTLTRPRVTEVNERHPTMRWIVMSDVNFDKTSIFSVERMKNEVPLLTSVREVMAAAKKDGRRKVAAFGFSLTGTDLTLRVAFPLMLANILDWFAGDDSDLITTYRTGQRFWVPMDGTYGANEVTVVAPDSNQTRAPLIDGRATFYGHAIGVHSLQAKVDGELITTIELAANLSNPSESNISPADALYVGGDDTNALQPPGSFEVSASRDLWDLLLFAVLLLLAVEWITYNRRVTV